VQYTIGGATCIGLHTAVDLVQSALLCQMCESICCTSTSLSSARWQLHPHPPPTPHPPHTPAVPVHQSSCCTAVQGPSWADPGGRPQRKVGGWLVGRSPEDCPHPAPAHPAWALQAGCCCCSCCCCLWGRPCGLSAAAALRLLLPADAEKTCLSSEPVSSRHRCLFGNRNTRSVHMCADRFCLRQVSFDLPQALVHTTLTVSCCSCSKCTSPCRLPSRVADSFSIGCT
jgi:hypothetical protein